MELRVTTGSAKNKRLLAPNIPGFRAVQEVAKSSMFSIIGNKIKGAVCLDLFSGSGNLGIEALSREALWVDFVDGSRESVEVIRENLVNCGFFEKSSVTLRKAGKYVASTDKMYDFVFMDPFYDDLSHKHLLILLKDKLKPGGNLFYFHSAEHKKNVEEMIKNAGFEILDLREFGASVFAVATTRLDQSDTL